MLGIFMIRLYFRDVDRTNKTVILILKNLNEKDGFSVFSLYFYVWLATALTG